MDFSAFPPLAAVLDTAQTLLVGFAGILEPLAGPFAAALAIVLVTLAVRAGLIPLGVLQVRAEITRRRLAPRIAELRRRYGKNPELLQRKTLELYRAEGVSPFAGMLPALAQLPVVSLIYGVAVSPTLNGHPNELLDAALFTAPLGSPLTALVAAGDGLAALVPLGLMVIIAVVATLTRRQMLRMSATAGAGAASPELPRGMLGAMSWLPFLSVGIAAFLPLAAALYVAVSMTWTFAERTILRRRMTPRDVV